MDEPGRRIRRLPKGRAAPLTDLTLWVTLSGLSLAELSGQDVHSFLSGAARPPLPPDAVRRC